MANFKVGHFQKQATIGAQAVTGLGFQPKAILFWTSGAQGSTGVLSSHVFQMLGMTTGATESRAVAGTSADAVTTSNTRLLTSTKAVAFVAASGVILAQADLTSFDADGFTLNWTTNTAGTNSAGNVVINYVAFDVPQAKILQWQSNGATGNQAVTGVGFSPDLIFTINGPTIGVAPPTSAAEMAVSLGAFDGSSQWGVAMFSDDGLPDSDTSRWQSTTYMAGSILGIATGIARRVSGVSLNADGFTVNKANASNSEYYFTLCLGGVKAKVGTFGVPAATGPGVVSGIGFAPEAVLLAGVKAGTLETVSPANAFVMGASDGTAQRSATQYDRDAVAITEADSKWSNQIWSSLGSVGAVDSEANLTSFDADGFTLDWTDASNTAGEDAFYIALAIENTTPNAPILTSPVAGATVDRTAAINLVAAFSDPDAGDQLSGYEVEYRTQAGTGLVQPGEQAASGQTGTYTITGGTLAAGGWEWRARTRDNAGALGDWSAWAQFTAAAPPTAPVLTQPGAGATIATNPSTTEWTATVQAAFQVQTRSASGGGGTLHHDSGTVTSTSRTYSTPRPVTGRTEWTRVRVMSSGLWSAWTERDNAVAYTPPDSPTVAVSATGGGALQVAITNPAGVTAVTSNRVLRQQSLDGGMTWTDEAGTADAFNTVARDVAPDGTYTDYRVAHRVLYRYAAVAVGDNTTETTGAFTA